MSLIFEPDAHLYTLDGVVLPSVTGTLKAAGLIDFSNIPPSTLEAARVRGTTVHRAIHFYNEQDLNVAEFTQTFPDYEGYLRAWLSFRAQRAFLPLLNEHRIASRRHRVAGTLDCLGVLDHQGALLDFATGRPEDAAKDLQTAAYYALALEWASEDAALTKFFKAYPVVRRFAVHLMRDGTFRLEPYTAATDWRQFLTLRSALDIVQSRKGAQTEFAAVA